MGGLLASLDLHRLDYNAEPSRVARGGGPSSMGGVSFCSRSPPSGIAAPSRVTKGGGTAGEGGGAGGDADDVAIGRRRILFASALDFRPFLRLSPPLLVCLTFSGPGHLLSAVYLGLLVFDVLVLESRSRLSVE